MEEREKRRKILYIVLGVIVLILLFFVLKSCSSSETKDNDELAIPLSKNENKERIFHAQVIYPIVSDGDPVGSVVLMSKEPNKKMTDTELKVVQSAAGILGSQLEI